MILFRSLNDAKTGFSDVIGLRIPFTHPTFLEANICQLAGTMQYMPHESASPFNQRGTSAFVMSHPPGICVWGCGVIEDQNSIRYIKSKRHVKGERSFPSQERITRWITCSICKYARCSISPKVPRNQCSVTTYPDYGYTGSLSSKAP